MAIARTEELVLDIPFKGASEPVSSAIRKDNEEDYSLSENQPVKIDGTTLYRVVLSSSETDCSSLSLVLTDQNLTQVVATVITDEFYHNIQADLAVSGILVIGRGKGSVSWHDTITDGVKPVKNAVVKAYKMEGSTVDWTKLLAMDRTNTDGEYILYLNPGKYVLSIERNKVQVTTIEIEVG